MEGMDKGVGSEDLGRGVRIALAEGKERWCWE